MQRGFNHALGQDPCSSPLPPLQRGEGRRPEAELGHKHCDVTRPPRSAYTTSSFIQGAEKVTLSGRWCTLLIGLHATVVLTAYSRGLGLSVLMPFQWNQLPKRLAKFNSSIFTLYKLERLKVPLYCQQTMQCCTNAVVVPPHYTHKT